MDHKSSVHQVFFSPKPPELVMAQRLEAIGHMKGDKWDDGSDHDGVSKIYVRGGREGIHFINFEYPRSGQLKSGKLVGVWEGGFTEIFEINHLNNEHLESVEGYYDDDEYGYIKAIQFKTNFRVSEMIGYETGTKFSLAVTGKKIVGFHGYLTYMGTANMISLGAYFTWIPPSRLEAKGGQRGTPWDDGADHEGVTKIHVRGGSEGIQYIKFDYVKSGQPKVGSVHGLSGRGFTQTFKINHINNEHLISVEGYYDETSGVIQALQFITNIKTSDMMGYENGNKFSLTKKGKKIIGFHGYAEKNLNSLGAYYTAIPLTKSECHGGSGGSPWDDGVFIGIKKVMCSHNNTNVGRIRFEYHDTLRCYHGQKMISDKEEEFELDYPNEFITSVEGTFKRFSPGNVKVTSLIFKSSRERTSPTFGIVSGTKFVLESKGCTLVGFHGRQSKFDLLAIGAYFYPFPPLSTTNKLEARGGDGGAFWEDGVFDSVRKIYVGQGENGVAFLKFVYDENNKVVIGDDHGSKKVLDVKEFELEYPSEYIIAEEGSYDKSFGNHEVGVITMLRFWTNKRTSIPVGFESSSSFLLYKDECKIVGFHGKASNMIHQLGVHVVPITN